MIRKGKILELGAGQGWASCLYKRLYNESEVIVTDINEHALKCIYEWERLYSVKADKVYACKSYKTKEPDNSIDQVFCFAAAHHFIKQEETLKEISRILKKGGKAFYFHEPVTPRIFYKPIHAYVNRNMNGKPHEDVLITKDIKKYARKYGLVPFVDLNPSLVKRKPFATVYFAILKKIPLFRKVLPASAVFYFKKL